MLASCGIRKLAYCLSFVAIIFLFAVAGLRAQETTGRILGTVLDAQGGAVPGGQIAITNQETGAVRNVTSGADGLYSVPQVPAGKYTVAVSATGFARSEVRNVEVVVATDTRIDLKLQVGSLQQTVTVSEAVPLVDTTSSSLGGTVTEQSVSELPLNGRNWEDLTLLQPGISQSRVVAQSTINFFPGFDGTMFSSNGASIRSNMVSLDGANTTTLFGLNSASINNTTLGVDGIKEYKVVTSMFDAEYGLRTGSQTTIVSKGGTNRFHGDAFEYLRNSSLDARNYFDALDTNNANGFGTDKSLTYPGKRIPPFRRNNFGGSFGGPIQKDKTFFFAVYEGIRAQTGITITTVTLPAGCFVNGVVPAVIANNGCVAGSAASPITVNPIILPFARLFPRPNAVGYPTFNFTYPYLQPSTENYGQMRVDHVFSAADSFFARYTQDNANSVLNNPYPQFTTPLSSVSQFATVAENHVFSPTLLNTVRVSFSRTVGLDGIPCSSAFHLCGGPAPPGVPASNPFFPTEPFAGVTPGSGVTGLNELGSTIRDAQDMITLSDDVFWTKGKHSFKFGTLVNNLLANPNYVGFGAPTFANLASFFVGNYSSFFFETPNSVTSVDFRYWTLGFYVQDDYRMSSRLTLNLGLRYEFSTTPVESNPAIRGAVRYPLTSTTETPGPPFLNNSLHNFSPRIGFAWDPTGKGKTALRGGAGIYYDVATWGQQLLNYGISNPPFSQNFALQNTLASPLIPLTEPMTVATSVPQSPREAAYNLQQPTMAQYNLTVAQQLPWGMGLTVGYIGSHGWHLFQLREGNPVVPLALTANGLPITCNANAVGACPGAVLPRRYNPAWAAYQLVQAAGVSSYNSLQVQLNKRISQGLEFGFAYTWSKLLDDGMGLFTSEGTYAEQNQLPSGYSERTDWGPSGFDVASNARFNMTYHAPNFMKSNGIAGKFLNGWWLSSIVSAQTGYPITPILGSDRALEAPSTNFYERPNLDPSFNRNTAIVGKPSEWFNPSMFDLPTAGTFGNAGKGILRGPGLQNVDFSLVKDTKVGFLGEAGSVEFRAEIFNLLNHVNFGLPNTTIWTSGTPTAVPSGQIGTAAIPASGTAGQITSTANNSRQIQFAIKLLF